MASIEEVRAGIGQANDKAQESLSALQQAHSSLEQAQGLLQQTTDGIQMSPVRVAQMPVRRNKMGPVGSGGDSRLEHPAWKPPLAEDRTIVETLARLEPAGEGYGHACGRELAQVELVRVP